MRRRKKRPLTGVGLLVGLVLALAALYFFSTVVLVPYLVRTWLPGQLSSQWQRKVVVEAAAFDPFSGRLTVERGSIGPGSEAEEGGRDIFAFSRLTVDFESASFFKGGFITREIVLADPVVRIVRYEDRSTNFAHLMPLLSGENLLSFISGGAKIAGRGYSLNNISVRNGLITLEDRLSKKNHEARNLYIDLPAIASISYPLKTYLPPRFSSLVNNSPLEIEGVAVEGEVLESRMHLKGEHIDLSAYLGYFPAARMPAMKKGWADCDLTLQLSFARESGMRLLVAGRVDLRELEFATDAGGGTAKIEGMEVHLRAEPLVGKYQVEKVSVIRPEITLVRGANREKSISGESFFPFAALGSGVRVDGGVVGDGRIFFQDRAVAGGFSEGIGNISLRFDSEGDGEDHAVNITGNALSRTRAAITLRGRFVPAVSRFEGDINVDELPLDALEPYWKDLFAKGKDRALKKGRAKFSGRLLLSGKKGESTLRQGMAVIDDLVISSGEHGIVLVPEMKISDISIIPDAKQLVIGLIEGEGVWFSFSRDSGGGWSGPGLGTGPEPRVEAASGQWDVVLNRVLFRESTAQVHLASGSKPDGSSLPAQTYAATSVFFEYGAEGEEPGRGRVAGKGLLPANGSFSFSGPVRLGPRFSADLECSVSDMDLASHRSLFSSWLVPEITGGTASAQGRLLLPEVTFSGQAGVSRLSAAGLSGDSRENRQIIQWHDATATGIEARLEPFALQVAMLSVDQPYFFWNGAGPGATGFSTFFTSRNFLENISGEPPVRINTLRFAKGILDYTGPGQPSYFFSITDLDGELAGLESRAGNRASFSLQGKVAATAPLMLDGTLGFFEKGGAFSVKSRLEGLALAPFSGALESSLGMKIASGELTMVSGYQKEGERVNAAHSLEVKNLILGESADGSRLPLAAALLQENGSIRMEVALDGPGKDRDLSITKNLEKKIRSLAGTATVAPFNLVQDLFPGGKPVEQVSFALGSAELNAKSREDLKNLAALLARRPGLALVLHGSADGAGDRNAIMEARKKKAKLLEQAAAAVRQSATPTGKNGEKGGAVPEEKSSPAPPPSPPPVEKRDLAGLARERGLKVARYLVEDLRVEARRITVRDETEIVPAHSPGGAGNRVRFILDVMK